MMIDFFKGLSFLVGLKVVRPESWKNYIKHGETSQLKIVK